MACRSARGPGAAVDLSDRPPSAPREPRAATRRARDPGGTRAVPPEREGYPLSPPGGSDPTIAPSRSTYSRNARRPSSVIR